MPAGRGSLGLPWALRPTLITRIAPRTEWQAILMKSAERAEGRNEKAQPLEREVMEKKRKVLFLSTGNSTRSQIAEGFLHRIADNEFAAASAGIEPGGPDPLGVEVMKEAGIAIGQHVEPLSQAIKEHFAYVVTFDDPTKEKSPIFPLTVNFMPWSLADRQGWKPRRKRRRRYFGACATKSEIV